MRSFQRLLKRVAKHHFDDENRWEDIGNAVLYAVDQKSAVDIAIRKSVSATGRIKAKNIPGIAAELKPFLRQGDRPQMSGAGLVTSVDNMLNKVQAQTEDSIGLLGTFGGMYAGYIAGSSAMRDNLSQPQFNTLLQCLSADGPNGSPATHDYDDRIMAVFTEPEQAKLKVAMMEMYGQNGGKHIIDALEPIYAYFGGVDIENSTDPFIGTAYTQVLIVYAVQNQKTYWGHKGATWKVWNQAALVFGMPSSVVEIHELLSQFDTVGKRDYTDAVALFKNTNYPTLVHIARLKKVLKGMSAVHEMADIERAWSEFIQADNKWFFISRYCNQLAHLHYGAIALAGLVKTGVSTIASGHLGETLGRELYFGM